MQRKLRFVFRRILVVFTILFILRAVRGFYKIKTQIKKMLRRNQACINRFFEQQNFAVFFHIRCRHDLRMSRTVETEIASSITAKNN